MKNFEIIFTISAYFVSTLMAIQPMVGFNPISSKEHLLKTYLKCLVWPLWFIGSILWLIIKSWADLPDTNDKK